MGKIVAIKFFVLSCKTSKRCYGHLFMTGVWTLHKLDHWGSSVLHSDAVSVQCVWPLLLSVLIKWTGDMLASATWLNSSFVCSGTTSTTPASGQTNALQHMQWRPSSVTAHLCWAERERGRERAAWNKHVWTHSRSAGQLLKHVRSYMSESNNSLNDCSRFKTSFVFQA